LYSALAPISTIPAQKLPLSFLPSDAHRTRPTAKHKDVPADARPELAGRRVAGVLARAADRIRTEQDFSVQYQLLGLGSGFFAHILATLLACWRRMLRAGGLAGLAVALIVEGSGFALTHQFPPSLITNVLAAALAAGVAYGVGATIFAGDLVRGALRALALLQGEAGARSEAARLGAQSRPSGASTSQVTPLPLMPAMPRPAQRAASARAIVPDFALSPVAPQVRTSLPVSAAHVPGSPSVLDAPNRPGANIGRGDGGGSFRSVESIENAPTQPVTICEEDSATVMLLPDNSLYVPKFIPRPAIIGGTQAGLDGMAGMMGQALPPDRGGRAGTLPPLGRLAPVSPPPDLYAPWLAVSALDGIDQQRVERPDQIDNRQSANPVVAPFS
jgi:hypothetical protein